MSTNLTGIVEKQVKYLVESVVKAAMADDYKEAMEPFAGQLTPQMKHMIQTVFESGVRVGASRLLGLSSGKSLK